MILAYLSALVRLVQFIEWALSTSATYDIIAAPCEQCSSHAGRHLGNTLGGDLWNCACTRHDGAGCTQQFGSMSGTTLSS